MKRQQCSDRLLTLLKERQQISLEEISALLDVDRSTVVKTVYQLRHRGHLVVEPGRGRRPNRYKIVA
jgi:biotin operon repressor